MELNIYFFHLLVIFLHLIMPCSAKTVRNITTDQASLLSMKSHLNLSPHHILESDWSTSRSVCDWVGIRCNFRHNRVAGVNISRMNVTGTLSTQLGNLSFLNSIDLSGNNFHGSIPEELAGLHRLRVIILSYNNFSGEVPGWLGFLSELRGLYLRNNSFTGFIPPSISNLSKLEDLDLASNSLQGNIPEGIENCHNLKTLNMASNQLTGSIPSQIFSISTLEGIALGNNKLYGDLPTDLCHNLPRLKGLTLSWNELGGQIPLTISNCSELRLLSLSYNNFSGVIPGEIGKLENLEQLYLGGNVFSEGFIPQEMSNLRKLTALGMERTMRIGSIPPALFNISTLQRINLASNGLTGEIPKEIGNLYRLETFLTYNNSLSGSIPLDMFNISTLRVITLALNQFSGTLPSNMGYGLPNLLELNLHENNLRGVIPNFLSNSTKLQVIQLQDNEFMGRIPESLGDLRFLQRLMLHQNNLTSQGPSFIPSLTKCQNLIVLSVSQNPLKGSFPVSIGNLSALERLYAYECMITGSIPTEVGTLTKLIQLSLSDNNLTGTVPTTMTAMQVLYLDNNNIDGSTLNTLCELHSLILINLSHNNILGPLPECLDKVASLGYIYFRNCGLTSLPSSLWSLKSLSKITFQSNSLKGSLPPEIGNLKVATHIDLSMNQFSGTIPSTFVGLSNLQYLHLDHNRLGESIPDLLSSIVSLEDLDLSYNNFTGRIPKSLEALKYLKNLNVSFNNLEGEIPKRGPFRNFTGQSFVFNNALCGESRFQVPPCRISATERRPSKKKLLLILVPLGIAVIVLVMVFTFILMKYRRKDTVSCKSESFTLKKSERISYYELLEATDKFSESNLLGSGSFGSVYEGILKDGAIVAVKVFHLQLEGAFKSFETECEVLRNLRHRNLIKVISSCCIEDFKALILQYMSNGSLEKWLYSHNYFLNFMQRLNIMIDIACGLEYLHHDYSTPMVHCDLKPSNVLLDENMVAHVSDFGIAKLLGEGESISHTITLATMGYIAPEYGLQGIVSTRCDVYSFGIMMMEVFTRTKPSNEMFTGDLILKSWVSNSTPHAVSEVVDANLIRLDEQHLKEKLKSLASIMELALTCTVESPNERIDMKDVGATLKKIKAEFLAYCGGT